MNYILPVVSIASIYAFRMLGLFMILPVFAILAQHYQHADASLIGIALGIYGLTQAILQMPFGILSDHLGRKPVIISGLILFVLGSILAATAVSIHMVILGRALQGAGAIGSTLLALVADVTPDNKRPQAMAIIGASIGGSVAIALVIGPLISAWAGLSGIFWTTAGLAFTGIIAVITIVPTPTTTTQNLGSFTKHFKTILTNTSLLSLNYAIFAQHAILTACFVVLPKSFSTISLHDQWKLYFAMVIIAFIGIWKFNLFKHCDNPKSYRLSVLSILLSQAAFMVLPNSLFIMIPLLFIFFFGFTLLEIMLPALISKTAPTHGRGTAMGIYSSCQFLGIFFGGAVGGILQQHLGIFSVFTMTVLLASSWLLITYLPLSGIANLKQDNTIQTNPRSSTLDESSK